MKKKYVLFVIFLIFTNCDNNHDLDWGFNPRKLKDSLIFGNGNFLSFTDIVHYENQTYCVFREGEDHTSAYGIIHIIKYHEDDWKTEDILRVQGYDLRDPKFLINPDGELCVHFAGTKRNDENVTIDIKNFIAFYTLNKNGNLILRNMEEIHLTDIAGQFWIWKMGWNNSRVYGVCYSVNNDHTLYLISSEDGSEYKIVTNLTCDVIPSDQFISETSFEFSADNTLKIVGRVDNDQGGEAVYGISTYPYTEWKWYCLGAYLAGPAIKTIYDKTYLAGRSIIKGKYYTTLFELEQETCTLKHIWNSSYYYDTGYPGIVYKDGELWMSYYGQPSSDNSQSNIHLLRYY